MWIVRLALRRPYTFIVMAIVIMILGALSIIRTPKDIFPNINIPVVTRPLELRRPFTRADGEPDLGYQPTFPHLDGE